MGMPYLGQTQLVRFLSACTNTCCLLGFRLFRSYDQDMRNTLFGMKLTAHLIRMGGNAEG